MAKAKLANLRLKRVYDPPSDDDGLRVLVDRLWPRGVSKANGKIDLWLKDVAPSDALRRELHGHPDAWNHFNTAYASELKQEPGRTAVTDLLEKLAEGPVTLLYAARDEEHNNAIALRDLLAAAAG